MSSPAAEHGKENSLRSATIVRGRDGRAADVLLVDFLLGRVSSLTSRDPLA
ncbi:MAG TPA: hypothetical protein VGQ75_06475 [Thermoanaerobaculia bacterium]|nr:hypothetical protein [Thermoanaerobaculia bacterium]